MLGKKYFLNIIYKITIKKKVDIGNAETIVGKECTSDNVDPFSYDV